jgi:hypothetical protein
VVGRGPRRALWFALAASVLIPGATAIVATPAAARSVREGLAPVTRQVAERRAAGVATRRPPVPFRRSTRVVLVGDSLAQESAPFIEYLAAPRAFVPKFWGGTAPCDWVNVDLQASRRTVVVITFTGNSLTPCMTDDTGTFVRGAELVARYRSDVATLIDKARRAGAAVVLVGQPVRAAVFDADGEVAGINAAYQQFAETMPYVSYVDAGASVEAPDGTYTDRLPCTEFDTDCDADGFTVVRGDGVHFCPLQGQNPCPIWSSGAFRFSLAIVDAATRPWAYE